MDIIPFLDAEAIGRTLAEMIAINSVNPQFPGGPGEHELANYVAHFFHTHGISYEMQAVCPGRSNVVARLEGQPGTRTIVLEAHMDTATELGMSMPPFQPTRRGNRIFGRGSCDTKGGLAAMMHAMKALSRLPRGCANTVVFAATVDEEHLFRGISKFTENGFKADGAIVAEPTNLKPIIASKGVLRWRVIAHGRTAHSSRPELGVNAIAKMAKLIVAVTERFSGPAVARSYPLLGLPTLSVGVIHGGNQVNQVPDACIVEVDRRWLPSETRDQVISDFEQVVLHLKKNDSEVEIELEPPYFQCDPLETPPGQGIVRMVVMAVKELGRDSSAGGVPYGSDASKLSNAGIDTVILGPGNIDEAHSPEEFVDLEEVLLAAHIYARVALKL